MPSKLLPSYHLHPFHQHLLQTRFPCVVYCILVVSSHIVLHSCPIAPPFHLSELSRATTPACTIAAHLSRIPNR